MLFSTTLLPTDKASRHAMLMMPPPPGNSSGGCSGGGIAGSTPRMPQQHHCPPSGHATPPKAAAVQLHPDSLSGSMKEGGQCQAFDHAAGRNNHDTESNPADLPLEGDITPAALTGALLSPTPPLAPKLEALPASPASPAPSIAARQLQAVLLSTSPRLLVIDDLFPPELCQVLINLARPKLIRSRVASGSETPSRTSSGTFFVREAAKAPPVVAAESLIEQLFASPAVRGPFGPVSKVEAMQVVHYRTGAYYHDHYDNRADGPLTRVATILVYLCDTPAGGATSFSRAVTQGVSLPAADLPPRVALGPGGQGVKVFPVQGRALVFWSTRPNGDEDPNSLHAADTVLAGEKWIASRWLGCAGG